MVENNKGEKPTDYTFEVIDIESIARDWNHTMDCCPNRFRHKAEFKVNASKLKTIDTLDVV